MGSKDHGQLPFLEHDATVDWGGCIFFLLAEQWLIEIPRAETRLVRVRFAHCFISPVLQCHLLERQSIGLTGSKTPHNCVFQSTKARQFRLSSPAVSRPSPVHLCNNRRGQDKWDPSWFKSFDRIS